MPDTRPRTKEHGKTAGVRRKLALLFLLALIAGTLHGTQREWLPAAAEEEIMKPERKARTVMYIMDEAGFKLRDEDADGLDQLNYSFALIRNGEADASHWTGIRKMRAFLQKHPHIDGVLAVGGWGADGFSDACMTEEGRKRLADSILALMDANGFVGVDIDWEYPGVSGTGIVSREGDVENWYALLALLREGLDAREASTGREHILSVAVGGGMQQLKVIDPARLNALVDQVVLMAYDLEHHNRFTGHHAGLYPEGGRDNTGASGVAYLLDGGLAPGRLLLGMPAYGRVWRQVTGSGDGLGQRAGTSGNKTISFDEVLRLTERGYKRHYDEKAQAAYWFDGSSYVSAEDDRSIAYKCQWLLEKGLQGAAVWQYTQDPSGAMLAMMNAALSE